MFVVDTENEAIRRIDAKTGIDHDRRGEGEDEDTGPRRRRNGDRRDARPPARRRGRAGRRDLHRRHQQPPHPQSEVSHYRDAIRNPAPNASASRTTTATTSRGRFLRTQHDSGLLSEPRLMASIPRSRLVSFWRVQPRHGLPECARGLHRHRARRAAVLRPATARVLNVPVVSRFEASVAAPVSRTASGVAATGAAARRGWACCGVHQARRCRRDAFGRRPIHSGSRDRDR